MFTKIVNHDNYYEFSGKMTRKKANYGISRSHHLKLQIATASGLKTTHEMTS